MQVTNENYISARYIDNEKKHVEILYKDGEQTLGHIIEHNTEHPDWLKLMTLTTIDEFITPNPEYVSPEDPLAYALNKMYVGGFRNVPIVNDEMYPIGIISISDIISTIADYFHNEIINLP